MSQSPFKFLDSYTKEDKEIFFGREREIDELYQKLFDSKTLVVYGVSGTGKTSLIYCGMANKLQESDWLPVSIRRGKDIVTSLLDELKSVEGNENFKEGKSNQGTILKTIRSIYLDHFKPIYLLFDQFEEIFIFGTKEERKEFAEIIKSIIESDLSCKIIFVIREEYLASLTEFEEFIPNILQNRFRVERMNRHNAINVIEGPCNKFGINVEENFANSLLDKLSEGGTNIELTYLQVYLDRLFNLAVEENKENPNFTLELLEKTGSITDLLGTFLNEQLAKMENPKVANSILKSFVSAKGTKKQLSIAEATESVQVFDHDIKAEQIRDYIVKFVNLRILRGEDEEGRYELRHDSLAAKIFEKISADEMELLEVRQFIENALVNYNKRQIMLSPDDFTYIGDREKGLNLNSELQDFVEKSRQNIKAKNRTVKRLTFLSAVALVLIIIALGKLTIDNKNDLNAENLAYFSILQYKNIEQRLTIANQAFKMLDQAITHEALISAFNTLSNTKTGSQKLDSIGDHYFYKFDSAPEEIINAESIKNSKSIFGFTKNYVLVWDSVGIITNAFNHGEKTILNAKISSDEKIIGLLNSDSLLTIFDRNGKKLFTQKIYYNILNPKQSFCITDQNQIITNSRNNIIILDSLGNNVQTLEGHKNIVNALSVSNDRKFFASVGFDTTVKIWYYNTVKQCYSLYNSIRCHKDTIWSVNFANRKNFIITASKDRDVLIRDFNNERGSFYNTGDSTYCYAEFSANNFGIISRRYRIENQKLKFTDVAEYVYKFYSLAHSNGTYEFNNLIFSPKTDYYSYSMNQKIFVASTRLNHDDIGNFIVYEAKGDNAIFSDNGDYLFVIAGNEIKPVFISAIKINQILDIILTNKKEE